MKLVAISNRSISKAYEAYLSAGISHIEEIKGDFDLSKTIRSGSYAITNDPGLICRSEVVDIIIEATGTVEYGAHVVLNAIKGGKHIVLMNAELDATLGPILKKHAERAGVIYSNSDGDEPGVAMNLVRYVKAIGLKPVVAGNIKGMYDRYRTPETQRGFAEQVGQDPQKIASFADGTKLSMELTVLANATGFKIAKRGGYGPKLDHVEESKRYYYDKLLPEGMVDFVVGASFPDSGAFVLGYTEDPIKKRYLKYLKMGEGPLYTFYTPFHLPQLEIPITVARCVLLKDPTITPLGGPVCDAIAFAKKNLKAGDVIDGFGGFACYSLIENYEQSCEENAVPIGVALGCRLTKDVEKDQILTYDDIKTPENRLCDKLRKQQHETFFE
jgi:predicted homoserine dehydrogenase-like protein